MQNAVILKGSVLDSRHIFLLEPLLENIKGEVEVIIRTAPKSQNQNSLRQFLISLPPGHKSKAEIDAGIQAERDAW